MQSFEKDKARFIAKIGLFKCGLVSGLVQAAVFNPWDRALYLSIKENRIFLHLENFRNPFSGLLQTLFQRACSAGLYFPLEDIFMTVLLENPTSSTLNSNILSFIAGNTAGALNGLVLNPLAAVKVCYPKWCETRQFILTLNYQYHTWGIEECFREHFFATARKMYSQGGIRPFVAGTVATVSRDMTFGGCFALLRHSAQTPDDTKTKKVVINIFAGFMATLLSSPMNYVRNIHYATPPSECHQSALTILCQLWKMSSQETSFFSRLVYLQHKLRVGWGTARVACGMALGAHIYDICSKSSSHFPGTSHWRIFSKSWNCKERIIRFTSAVRDGRYHLTLMPWISDQPGWNLLAAITFLLTSYSCGCNDAK